MTVVDDLLAAIDDIELQSQGTKDALAAAIQAYVAADLAFTFTPAAGGANVCEVTIQAKDEDGADLARAVPFLLWLTDAATGIGLTGTAASGAVAAKAASGTDFAALTAKKAIIAQTKADGSYVLSITDTAKTLYYVAAMALGYGVPSVSAQLEATDYGS